MSVSTENRLSRPQVLRRGAFGSFILLLTVATFSIFGSLHAQRVAFQTVDHTHEVQTHIASILSWLNDAESGERGYLLTDDLHMLESFRTAVTKLPPELAALSRLTADNGFQQTLLARIRQEVQSELTNLSETLRLKDSNDSAGAVGLVRSGRGARLMQSLREDLQAMDREEQRLLQERTARASRARIMTLWTVAIMGGSALLFLWLLRVMMMQSTARALDSERRLASTLASVGDAVITTDAQGTVERMNPVAEQLTGWSFKEARGKRLEEVFHIINANSRQTTESPLSRVLREGQVIGLANHTLLIARDGTERPIDDSGAPIRDESGLIVGVVLVFRDVTERYHAERQLADSEARFRGTFDNAAVGIAHVALDGRFVRLNDAFLKITGYTRDALAGRSFAEITYPADLQGDWEQARALAQGEIENYTLDKRYLRPDGSTIWVTLTVGLQRDERGAPLFYISVIQDATARREAARAVRESEARFRDIADTAPVLIWISDIDGGCIWFNSRWLNFTGRTMEQELGQGWMEGVHPEDVERCVRVYEKAFARREAYATEYRRRRADGEWRTLDASGVPRYVDSVFVGYVGACIDITEQKAAIAALAHSEEQLRLATEAAEIGLWDVDPICDRLYWPPRVKAMFGISADVPVSMKDFYAGLHPEDRERVEVSFAAAMDPARRALYDVEYRTIGKEDQVVRCIAAKGRGIFKEEVCVRVIGTAIDITARKAIEAELRELNERLEHRVTKALADRKLFVDIIEATDVGVQVLDPNFQILAINRSSAANLERAYGLRPQAGQHLLDLFEAYPRERSLLESYWSRALRGEEYSVVEEFGGAADNRRSYEMKFNALRDREGRFVGAFQFAYDVTERLKDHARLAEAERHLRHAQKIEALGQLTGGVAHDFNNLLMVISGGLSLLQRSQDATQRERTIERMRLATEKGASLSRQLLTFARRQPLHPVPIDLNRHIGGMREILDRTLRGDVSVKTRMPSNLWPVLIDPAELELAVLNLCVNARDAMPTGGTIVIEAANAPNHPLRDARGDFVVLSVIDNGVGMPAEVLGRVFEPFFTTKPLGAGSGLGLAQVYGFSQQSGGTTTIESVEGKGTVVRLFLPRSANAPVSAVKEVDNGPGIGAQRALQGSVLLVEDSDEVAALVTEMLVELGYRVTRVESAKAALGALADRPDFDTVFTDVMMPGAMNGIELARELRHRRPELAVLLTTGYGGVALESAYADDIEVLHKPYGIQALHSALQSAMLKAQR